MKELNSNVFDFRQSTKFEKPLRPLFIYIEDECSVEPGMSLRYAEE